MKGGKADSGGPDSKFQLGLGSGEEVMRKRNLSQTHNDATLADTSRIRTVYDGDRIRYLQDTWVPQ